MKAAKSGDADARKKPSKTVLQTDLWGRGKRTPRVIVSEEDDQIAFMGFLEVAHHAIWKRTWHTPNGGKRHPAVARKLKLMGVKKGMIDLITLVPSMGYIGLVVEMKAAHETMSAVTKEQRETLTMFEESGFLSCVAFGYDGVFKVYSDYFGWGS